MKNQTKENHMNMSEIREALRDDAAEVAKSHGWEVNISFDSGEAWVEFAEHIETCCPTNTNTAGWDWVDDGRVKGTLGSSQCGGCGRFGFGWARSGAVRVVDGDTVAACEAAEAVLLPVAERMQADHRAEEVERCKRLLAEAVAEAEAAAADAVAGFAGTVTYSVESVREALVEAGIAIADDADPDGVFVTDLEDERGIIALEVWSPTVDETWSHYLV